MTTLDANMSPRYDPSCHLQHVWLRWSYMVSEVRNLIQFGRITDDSIILMGDTIVGGRRERERALGTLRVN